MLIHYYEDISLLEQSSSINDLFFSLGAENKIQCLYTTIRKSLYKNNLVLIHFGTSNIEGSCIGLLRKGTSIALPNFQKS